MYVKCEHWSRNIGPVEHYIKPVEISVQKQNKNKTKQNKTNKNINLVIKTKHLAIKLKFQIRPRLIYLQATFGTVYGTKSHQQLLFSVTLHPPPPPADCEIGQVHFSKV